MEPDVIRIYSSSPPPMEDGAEEEDDEFGDFGTFSGVPNSVSLTEFDTPTSFNQSQALTATSPPELLNSRGVTGSGHSPSNGTLGPNNELSKANGHVGTGLSGRTDVKRVVSGCLGFPGSEPADCNGGTEVLTNGFATFDLQGSPSSQNSVHSHVKATEDDFADFAAFSSSEGQTANEGLDHPTGGSRLPGASCHSEHCNVEHDVRDSGSTPPSGSCYTDRGSRTHFQQRDVAFAQGAVCTKEASALNGVGVTDGHVCTENKPSPDGDVGRPDGNEAETSLGRPLSTDALQEYGDISTPGSSPPPRGETAVPEDQSQLGEDDEDGDFGDPGSFSSRGFAEFDQPHVPLESRSQSSAPPQEAPGTEDDDFGDFNGGGTEDGGQFAEFPVSHSFGNFRSAADAAGGEADEGWSAFGELPAEGESWAAFGAEPSAAPPGDGREEEEEEEEDEWHQSDAPAASVETSRTSVSAPPGRLEKLFQVTFPHTAVPQVVEEVVSLQMLLEPPEEERRRTVSGGVWMRLQDIHEALGLRYQWGGSHCNKALLCCLGIDTRNILFTGQKKQPVIVPMYAAGLGMLEPTKEPVKPVSAAEMIASIAQAPPAAPETSSCPTDPVQQEALPPVQFDWSSSGLTNPLDASGGSSLLNLDFFGPVEDSGSSSSPSIPGVDPELYELTTAKLDPGSRVADAFARLMSTMEKTSTSTRKLKKDENLSEEAAKVIAGLPDLSFMQAKVLMFPTTLTPLGSRDLAD